MTVVYAESSAVLTWLLGEPGQDAVIRVLESAESTVTSAITVVECARALVRARHTRRITAADETAALRLLDDTSQAWNILDVTDDVIAAACRRFPHEPVRSLDALHLASAMTLRDALGALQVVSLDDRVRRNAAALGMMVGP
ncbi:MAG TPA: type II toxin-antitoxin system VapC family toxin [Gemmatimonadaceae bacterium]|nr:type II toxin-antitoxin system VapC family toxin [Gemmatimonadaceae bacterium]